MVITPHLQTLTSFIQSRLKSHFTNQTFHLPANLLQEQNQQDPLSNFVIKHNLNINEYLLLLIALAPHIYLDFYDEIIKTAIPEAGDFPQLGGVRGKNSRSFLPTGETALFLIGGRDVDKRQTVQQLFSPDHFFAKNNILSLQLPPDDEPQMAGKIILSQEYVDLFTIGKVSRPAFSLKFPAQQIETKMEWDNLILQKDILNQIAELETWIKHGDTLMNEWGMGNRLKPGYRVLFHGPPGTGKTLTASLLGKYTGKEVYKIDLSMVVSKFIGETEKNLASLFTKAENKDWILFFDEADALFGKRTNVRDAHDKYANQEVSYLLQRVEDYNGLVILASNFMTNIDDAFVRRFQSIIHFPMPGAPERLRLWKQAFPDKVELHEAIDLSQIAQKYELSGAEIINIVQYVCLTALKNCTKLMQLEDVVNGVRREYQKEGRAIQ